MAESIPGDARGEEEELKGAQGDDRGEEDDRGEAEELLEAPSDH